MDSVATLVPWSSRVPFLLLEAPDPTVFRPKLPKRQGINPKGIPKNLKTSVFQQAIIRSLLLAER